MGNLNRKYKQLNEHLETKLRNAEMQNEGLHQANAELAKKLHDKKEELAKLMKVSEHNYIIIKNLKDRNLWQRMFRKYE